MPRPVEEPGAPAHRGGSPATVADVAAIALVNQKGGVGKTTVALGLAATAWSRGIDTLVVDLDPQANATTGLGVWDPPFSVDQALAEERAGSITGLRTTSSWPDHPEGVRAPSVVAATPTLAMREPQLLTDPIGANDRLSLALAGHRTRSCHHRLSTFARAAHGQRPVCCRSGADCHRTWRMGLRWRQPDPSNRRTYRVEARRRSPDRRSRCQPPRPYP